MQNLVRLSHIYINKEELVPINIGRLTCLQTLPLFPVGVEEGRGIEELGSLSQLQGRIKICKLELVRDMEEAMAAKLQDKKQIEELLLQWSEGMEQVEQDEGVLEGLQPHANLKGLTIQGYNGRNFPSWLTIGDHNPQTLLPNLTHLELSKCRNCVKLPSLGHLPNLTFLKVEGLSKVKSIGCEFYSGGKFPALKTLFLSEMESLEEWVEATKMDVFPSLEDLYVGSCDKLKSIPLKNGLPNLKKFRCSECKELRCIGDGLSNCTQLRELRVHGCADLESVPSLHGLSSLTKLKLYHCKELRCAPSGLQNCNSFEKLSIEGCDNMTSGLECLGSLKSLQDLRIYHCPKISWDDIPEHSWSCLSRLKKLGLSYAFSTDAEELPPLFNSIHHLHGTLEQLAFSSFQKIRRLAGQIQHLTALKSLVIWGCDELEALPEGFGNLTCLQSLEIIDCPNLKSLEALPSSLKELTLGDHYGGQTKAMPPYFDSMHQYIPTSLEKLTLRGSLEWNALPPQLQYLTTLERLDINSFGVETLPEWLGNLSSLQELEIDFCYNLMHLPSRQSMLRLTNLKSLVIWECPKLKERCNKESSGPEWSKISHIPRISLLGLDSILNLDVNYNRNQSRAKKDVHF